MAFFGFPFGGFGGFHGFGFPFFGRRFFPFFHLFPFHPFGFGFRDGEQRPHTYYAEYTAQTGDTMRKVAQEYNIPMPILSAFNSHISNPDILGAGDKVYIPRLCDMYCQKMYAEYDGTTPGPMQTGVMPYSGAMPNPMHTGVMPFSAAAPNPMHTGVMPYSGAMPNPMHTGVMPFSGAMPNPMHTGVMPFSAAAPNPMHTGVKPKL